MNRCIIIPFVLIICLLSACIGGGDGSDSETTTPPQNLEAIDGVVTQGEYDHQAEFSNGKFVVYWRFQDESIIFAMVAKTDGMIALGFEPEIGMKDADMVIGWVKGGVAYIFDCYSIGESGPHPEDSNLQGNDDITAYAGVEYGGFTTIEFSRKLITGDTYDKDIPTTGIFNVIWAYGPEDSITLGHTNKGGGMLKMDSADVVGY